jgi:DNA gyrase subunit A
MGIIGKLDKDAKVLVVTKNGFGKLTPIKDYRLQNRAGSGIKTAKIQEKNGPIIAAMVVRDEEELIAASKSGQTIRVELLSLPTQARATQGVRVMKLGENDFLVAATAA